jgi:hypothetical protein
MKNLKAAYDAIRNSDLDTLTGLLRNRTFNDAIWPAVTRRRARG